MKRFIAKISIYSFITILLVILINSYFLNKIRYDWGESPDFIRKFSYLKSKSKEYNTVFIGSSRIKYHINPIHFDSITRNTKSFNLGSSGMFVPASYFIAEKIINDTTLNLNNVILEFSFISDISKFLHRRKFYYWIDSEYLFFIVSSILESDKNFIEKSSLINQYFISYFDKYLALGSKTSIYIEDLNPIKIDDFEKNYNGYMSLDYQLLNAPTDGLKKNRELFLSDTLPLSRKRQKIQKLINDSNSCNTIFRKKIYDLIDQAEKRGITLIFLLQQDVNAVHVYNSFIDIPRKNKVDLSLDKQLYYAKNHFDNTHLNNKGANILTEKFAFKFLRHMEKSNPARSQLHCD